jgi:excisionase family DNA binding protein
MEEFLTTKEVADLLRIKERKVYELAGNGTIPVSRVTGKLLFPRDLVVAWVRHNTEIEGGVQQYQPKPLVLAGSHDPLLDWALRESGAGIATYFDGSLSGLDRLAQGQALAAGMHVFEPESETWNVNHVSEAMPGEPIVLIEWARRTQGLVVPPGNPKAIRGVPDLKGTTVIPRQRNAGSHVLLTHLCADAGLGAGAIDFLDPPARNETDVALAVAEGKADAGLAIQSAARQYRLDFVALAEERYDLAVWRRDVFEAPMQALLTFCRTPAFAARADELGGYDISGLGTVHYNGP